jgi:hypothetical protein
MNETGKTQAIEASATGSTNGEGAASFEGVGAGAVSGTATDARYDLGTHEAKSKGRGRKLTTLIAAVVIVVVVCVAGYFIWDTVREPDIAEYSDVAVQVVGLTDASGNAVDGATLTAAEIYSLDCERISATNTSDKAGQGSSVEKTAYGFGATMEAWLAQYGHTLTDYKRIIVHCKDGYETAILPGDTLTGEVYISIAKGKDALPEDMQPMRLIMPEMPPSQWVYGIDKITLEAA